MSKIKKWLCRVTLEPELEAEAALWTAQQCRESAEKFKRWGRQLEVKAAILESDLKRAYSTRPTPSLKALPLRVLRRN